MRRTRVLTAILIAVVMLASMLVMALPALASEIVLKKNTMPDNAAHYRIGDTIHYEIIVQNPLTNNATNTVTSLTDTLPDGTVVVLATNLVQVPGASNTYLLDYVVDANDMVFDEFGQEKWRVTNIVRAIGQDSFLDSFNALTEKNSMIDVLPAIDIEKYVNGVDADTVTGPIVTVGSTVTFRYVVTNTGNVTLLNVTITDDILGPIGAVVPSLAPGASFEYSVTALATAGQYHNTGTVVGTPNLGQFPTTNVTDADDGHYFGALISIDIEKLVSVDGVSWLDADTAPGPDAAVPGTVRFKVIVTNTGNVALTGIVVHDTDFVFTGVATSLAPGASDESDVLSVPSVVGQHYNLADVIGYAGSLSDTDEDAAHYWGLARPLIDIEKLVSVDGLNWLDADLAPGPNATVPGTVRFKVVVTNIGNVPLTSIVVNDTDFVFTGVVTTLAVGASDESDVLSVPSVVGQHFNLAAVIGYYGAVPATDEDEAYYWGLARPSIDIEKFVSVDGVNWLDADTAPGPNAQVPGTVRFKVIVTNTGNITLTGILVNDTDFTFTGVVTTLAPGASDESDIISLATVIGQHYNLADVVGYYTDAPPVTDNDPAHYYGVPDLNIDIEKLVSVDGGSTWQDADTATGPHVSLPATVQFKVIVTNNGNVTLTGIVVTDTDFTFTGVLPSLAPGASDESDVLLVAAVVGQHQNLATVIGYYLTMSDTDQDYAHYFGDNPSLDLEKLVNGVDADSPTGPVVPVGSVVTFTYIVTNTGNVTLTNIVVTDNQLGVIGTILTLAPGASATLTDTSIAIAGQYRNDSNATDGHVSDNDPGHYFGANPDVDLEKFVNGDDADLPTGPVVWVGDTVTFTFVVMNTGNILLTNLVVTDDVLGLIGTIPALTVGESVTLTRTVLATAGQHTNMGTVETNEDVSDTDPGNYFANNPCIDIEKLINGEDADCAPGLIICGDRDCLLVYEFIVTNCGNVALVNITVDDTIFGHIGDIANLAPGASFTFTREDFAECGQHSNIATAVGYPYLNGQSVPTDGPLFDQRSVTDFDLAYYYGKCAEIDLEKFVSVDGGTTWDDADAAPGMHIAAGSFVEFKFVVTNSGNGTLTYIEVMDDVLGYIGLIPFLEPGQSFTFFVDDHVALAGQHTNIGTAVSESCSAIDTDPGNYFGEFECIDIEKLIMGDDADVAPGWIEWCIGCTLNYEFIVTNCGNMPLTNIVVTDSVFGEIGTIQLLAPGEHVSFTRTAISLAGPHSNIATALASEGVLDTDYAYYFGALPAMDLEKFVNGEDADTAPGPVVAIGSVVTFQFRVTNTGNIGLENVVVYDDLFGYIGVIPMLSFGETETLTITRIAEAGQHTNMGTAMFCDWKDSDYGNYFGDEFIEPDPDEGMSISWWRNHRSEWVGYSTADVAGDIFNFPTSMGKLAAKNLFEILGGKIKMTDENATASYLLKAAIAALLNAAHPELNYPMSEAEIISDVNSALGSLNIGTMEDLTDELNEYNNAGGDID